MKWEKLATRENDFLKNCLLYEAAINNFPKVHKITHPIILTIRKGNTFSHFLNKEQYNKIDDFILQKLKKDCNYLIKINKKLENNFKIMLDFCHKLKNTEKKSNRDLMNLINKYFKLYKKIYPYFLISAAGYKLEKINSKIAKKAIQTLAKIRFYSREHYEQTHKLIHPLFEEIANRFNIAVEELKFLTPREINSLLKGTRIDIKQKIKDRYDCAFIQFNKSFCLQENTTVIVSEDKVIITDEIKGSVAFQGKVKGIVKLVKTSKDVKNMKKGEILVTRMTMPDMITKSIKKVAAIITDEGGITCHAAIVSRELKIPCIIGTKIATKILKDGDLVDFDSEQGIVKKL